MSRFASLSVPAAYIAVGTLSEAKRDSVTFALLPILIFSTHKTHSSARQALSGFWYILLLSRASVAPPYARRKVFLS
jgi:hypothetical protein